VAPSLDRNVPSFVLRLLGKLGDALVEQAPIFGMNTAISETLKQLQSALSAAEEAHAELETAKQKLTPLQLAADDADAKVHSLMSEYSKATGGPSDAPARRRRGGAGGKRAPRTLIAIASTAATRLLNQMKAEGKQKKAALIAAMDRVELVAKKRGESLTDEIKSAITAKAEEIWEKK
jgi:hypothetical protein